MTHPGSGERASAAVSAVNDAAAAVSAVAAAAGGASDGHSFARRFGDPRPSERRLGGLHVALPDGPFEGLDIRPWTAETVGVVDVDLRAGTVIDWAALQAALPYGPFRAEPQLDPGPPWFSVVAVRAGVSPSDVSPSDAAPAVSGSVLLLVEVRGEVVSAITLRRDPATA